VALFGCWQVLPRLPVLANTEPLVLQVACLPGLVACVGLVTLWNRVRGKPLYLSAWALITGAAGALGSLAVLLAFARGGQGSVVTPLCSMYPLLTALIARVWLGERWGRIQVLGLALFVMAVMAFDGEGAGATSYWASWMGYTVVAFVIFGVSGVTMKLASSDAVSALGSWSLGFFLVTLAMAAVFRPGLPANQAAWGGSLVYGALMGAGLFASFQAYARGRATVVTAVTALYPAVTVALAVALPMIAEPFGVRKGVAVLLSLAAGLALSMEPKGTLKGA